MDANEKQNDNTSEQIGNQDIEENPIVSYINEKRELYIKEIKRCEDMFNGCKEMITNCKLKGKKETEAQKFLRKLKRYLKDVKVTDNNVQMAINDLLDLRAQDEAVMKILAGANNQSKCTQTSKSIDFPQKRCMPDPLHFKDEVSIIYKQHVYQLVYSLLILHETITSFMVHQADIVWAIDTDLKKKKMTADEFLTILFPPKLSRKQCLECIEEVLHENGIDKIPYAGISKELSSWNAYIDSNGKKGTEPIMLYDFYREKGKKDFKEWVLLRYFPVFKNRKHRSVNFNKVIRGKAALDRAEEEHSIDPMDKIYADMDKTTTNDILEAIHQTGRVPDDLINTKIISNRKTETIIKKKKDS